MLRELARLWWVVLGYVAIEAAAAVLTQGSVPLLPLNVGDGADPTRRAVATKGGTPVLNAFPIRCFDPGTGRVAHPHAARPGLHPRPLRANSGR